METRIVKPLGEYVLVKHIKGDETEGGIVIPDGADAGDRGFLVVDKGIDVKVVQLNDYIVCTAKDLIGVKIEGAADKLCLVKEEHVIALLLDKT